MGSGVSASSGAMAQSPSGHRDQGPVPEPDGNERPETVTVR
jgi:hypothetical protein